MLRREHNEQVAKILSATEATANDKYVALMFLRNAEPAAKGILPFSQDTGTAIDQGEKGQQVWTGYSQEEAISKGVYMTFSEDALRQSQNAPRTMYEEVNTMCNLPAQIDIEATEGREYRFFCETKGVGSANKTYLYQETKAILNPVTLFQHRTTFKIQFCIGVNLDRTYFIGFSTWYNNGPAIFFAAVQSLLNCCRIQRDPVAYCSEIPYIYHIICLPLPLHISTAP